MKNTSTILIVDDAPEGRALLERLLTAEGYNLAFAGDGIEALAKAASLTPDLILMDVMMPHLNGFEVCQRLRADPLLAKVPVILITALDDRVSRLHGLELGADDFVTKPFDQTELLARVGTITQINRYRQLLLERAELIPQSFLELVGRQYQAKPETAWHAWPGQMAEATPRYLMQPETASAHAFWLQVMFFLPNPCRVGWRGCGSATMA